MTLKLNNLIKTCGNCVGYSNTKFKTTDYCENQLCKMRNLYFSQLEQYIFAKFFE